MRKIFPLLILVGFYAQVSLNSPDKENMDIEYLYRTLNLAHHLLNSSTRDLATDCWFCLSSSSAHYSAVPIPIRYWATSNMTLHPKYRGGRPFEMMNIENVFDFRISAVTKSTLTGRAANLLMSYRTNLTRAASAEPPIWGPISTHTNLKFQAPLCIKRSQDPSQSQNLGSLEDSHCNYTIEIEPSKDWSNFQVAQAAPFKKPVRFSWKPNIKTTGLPNRSSGYCQGRPSDCLSIFPWESCSEPSQEECLLLAAYENLTERVFIDIKRNFLHWENRTSGAPQHDSSGPLQPLTGAVLAGTLSTWESENSRRPNDHLFTIEMSFCLGTPGIFFLCGTNSYLCLPANWTGTCTLVYLAPEINIAPNNQSVTIPLTHARTKRATQFFPRLTDLGVAAGVGTGTAGLASSLSHYQSLSKDLSESLEDISKSILTLQSQLDSLAGIALQNRRRLDLLKAEKGGLCLFLEEECCFYANQSGIVRDAAKRHTLTSRPHLYQPLGQENQEFGAL